MMLFYFTATTKVQRNLLQKLISTGIIAINIAQKESWVKFQAHESFTNNT